MHSPEVVDQLKRLNAAVHTVAWLLAVAIVLSSASWIYNAKREHDRAALSSQARSNAARAAVIEQYQRDAGEPIISQQEKAAAADQLLSERANN